VKLRFISKGMLSADWLTLLPFELDLSVMEVWLARVASEEGSDLGDVSLVFCSDDELLEMNVQHLNHDYYTDVITFDYSDDLSVSGDLFISVDRVKENAATHKCKFNNELSRVIVHGVLHLCGYKDKSIDESFVMRKKEDYYLNMYEGST
jgi:probable rRNA maturation factor